MAPATDADQMERAVFANARTILAAFFCAAGLAGCVDEGSEAQRAYNACRDSWNNERHRFPSSFTFVSAVSNGETRCFWAWGGSSEDVGNQAVENCRAAGFRCYTFGNERGLFDWSRNISDNGGSDGSAEANNDAAAEFLNAAVGLGAGIAAGRSGGGQIYAPPSVGTGLTGYCNAPNIDAQIASLQARASSLGICRMSRESASLYRNAAAAYRRCNQPQNASYMDNAARQSDATAAASCSGN
jgi:hypothetical protein